MSQQPEARCRHDSCRQRHQRTDRQQQACELDWPDQSFAIASDMSSSFDVLGDPAEYQEWLALQQSPQPVVENKQDDLAQHVTDLPDDIARVVSRIDHQYACTVLSAYQSLQRSRCAVEEFIAAA